MVAVVAAVIAGIATAVFVLPRLSGTGPVQASPPAPSASASVSASPGDLLGVVRSLARSRAAALMSGVEESLADVDVPGSQAWAADAALLHNLREAGLRLAGLGFTVETVTTQTLPAQSLVGVLVRVGTSAHQQVDAQGRVTTSVAQAPTQVVRLVLARSEAGWRILSAVPT